MTYIISLIALLTLLGSTTAQDPNEPLFPTYPNNSLPCLNTAAYASGCPQTGINSVVVTNNCLCGNQGFLASTANCIGRTDNADLDQVWGNISANCAATASPLGFTKAQFYDAAKSVPNVPTTPAATTPSTTSKPTQNSSPTTKPTGSASASSSSPSHSPTTSPQSGGGGLSADGKAGVGVGVTAAVLALIGVIFRKQLEKHCNCFGSRRRGESNHELRSTSYIS